LSEDTESTESVAPPEQSTNERRRTPELGRGTCIGRYVILDRLGQGGMGIVYQAYDPDLDRRVALKLVRDLHDEATARLIREAQALAKVSHPNIVQVFDVGLVGDSVFIAMELVEGRTLSRWHRAEQAGWRATLAKLIDAARGLAGAHAAGLIHRDFKPNNAIVGSDGRVRVLDFGLARVASTTTGDSGEHDTPRWLPESVSLTTSQMRARLEASRTASGDATPSTAIEIPRAEIAARAARLDLDGPTEDEGLPRVVASRVIGTPVYMAPEQRKRGIIDARADQFGFAVAAWELLYGERPFDGADNRAYAEAAANHRLRPPPPGSDVPAWLRRVLVRALSPAPADRYRSMNELIDALSADPSARWRRAAVVAALVVAIGGGAAALLIRGKAPAPCQDGPRHLAGIWDRDVAARLDATFAATHTPFAGETATKVRGALDARAAAWIGMHRDACLATRVRGEQSAEMLDLRMGCLDRRRDELRALVGELVRAPDVERVRNAVDAVRGLPGVASCADRDALTAVVPLPSDPAQRVAIADQRRELAAIKAVIDTGQWDEGRLRAERAQTQARRLGWAPLIAEAAYQRGQAERHAGNLHDAEAALVEAAQAAARAHLDDLATLAWSELVDVVGYEEGRPIEGLALAIAADAAALRSDAPPITRAGIHHARAMVLMSKGDIPAALAEAQLALGIDEELRDDVEAAEVLNTIGMLEANRGDYAAAEDANRRVLARRTVAFGASHPKVADSLDNLGVVLHHTGRYAEARERYEWALALRVAALGPAHRDVGTSHNNIGGLLMDMGDDAEATRHMEQALAIYEGALGADHPDLAVPLSNLGELANRRGDPDRALDHCRRALALEEPRTTPDDPDLAYDLVCIGEAQLGRGAIGEARAVLERALKLREGPVDAVEKGRTRFALAQALWRTPGGHERPRARGLAEQALKDFADAGDPGKDRAAKARRWLQNPR